MRNKRGDITRLAAASCCFLMFFGQERLAAYKEPRACITIEDDQQGGLQDGQSDVLSDHGRLDHLGRQFRVQTFSLWGKYTPDSTKTCLRYEIQNLEQIRLEAVRWSDAGIHFADIAEQDRIGWVRESSSPYPAIVAPSEIRHFRIHQRQSELTFPVGQDAFPIRPSKVALVKWHPPTPLSVISTVDRLIPVLHRQSFERAFRLILFAP